jgi:hypothetical protein
MSMVFLGLSRDSAKINNSYALPGTPVIKAITWTLMADG